jgi:hypothetical protein
MRAVLLTIIFSSPVVAATTEIAVSTGPWWLPHFVTLLGVFIAAVMIVYQLGRQHANESARLNENFKGQLKLQIYQEFSQRLSSASSAVGATGLHAMFSQTNMATYAWRVEQGMNPKPIANRAMDLADKNHTAATEATEVIFLVEKYHIVHPDLDIFKTAISSALHDLHATFHALFDFMVCHLPVGAQTSIGSTLLNVKPLDTEELEALRKLARAYQNAAMELNCYLMDMRVELQKLLLGHLFPSIAPLRRPVDPANKVITLDPASVTSLHHHFTNNTGWGKQWAEAQNRAHREYHEGRQPPK